MEFVNPALYNDYVMDLVLERRGIKETEERIEQEIFRQKEPIFKAVEKGSPLLRIKKISALAHDHPAKKYVEKRLIPSESHYRLYYAPKFKKWVNSILPDKMEQLENDEPRLIIPFMDSEGRMFGFQGRSFNPKAHIRYITIMIDETYPKIFGLDKVDTTKPYYILEGPLDALFVPNSISMAGSSVSSRYVSDPENAVYVFDNEPRKEETVAKMNKIIRGGGKLVIWNPKNTAKDVNDMILGGMSVEKVLREMKTRTFRGLDAMVEFSGWRKVNV